MMEDAIIVTPLAEGDALEDTWQNYYELTWAVRKSLFQSIIDEGVTDLARVMGLFNRRYSTRPMGAERRDGFLTGKVHLGPLPPPSETPWEQLEKPRRGILLDKDVLLPAFAEFNVNDLLCSLAQGCDTVVELGSGFGRRLFDMYLSGFGDGDTRYCAFEPSKAGRDLTSLLSALSSGLDMRTADFDFINPDLGMIPTDGRKTMIFSCWAACCVPTVSASLFDQIAALPQDVVVVFIEPLGFQISRSPERSRAQAESFVANDFNQDLFAQISAASARACIEPLLIVKDVFGVSDDPLSWVSVIVCSKI